MGYRVQIEVKTYTHAEALADLIQEFEGEEFTVLIIPLEEGEDENLDEVQEGD